MLIKDKSTQGIPRAKGSLCEDQAGTSSPRMLAAACCSLVLPNLPVCAGEGSWGLVCAFFSPQRAEQPLPATASTPSWPPRSWKEVTLSRKHSKHKCHRPQAARAETRLPFQSSPWQCGTGSHQGKEGGGVLL